MCDNRQANKLIRDYEEAKTEADKWKKKEAAAKQALVDAIGYGQRDTNAFHVTVNEPTVYMVFNQKEFEKHHPEVFLKFKTQEKSTGIRIKIEEVA